MALPRKKTRPISVAGTGYRWGSFRAEGALEIRVELQEEPASQLFGRFERDARGGYPTVGPGLVAALIQAGLAQGWEPGATTPREFVVQDVAGLAREHDLRARQDIAGVILAPPAAPSAPVRDTIVRVLREVGVQACVAAATAETPAGWIERADLVVADVSGTDSNVMYELGYAHALGKPTVLLVDGTGEHGLPSALAGNLFLTYSPGDLAALHGALKKAVLRSIRAVASR